MTVYLIVDLVCHNFYFPSHSYDLTVIFFYFYVLIMTIYLIVDLVSSFWLYARIITIHLIVDLVS